MMVSEEASSVVGAVRQEVVVEASQEHAFVVFTQRCDQWWPSHYRLGQGERANLTIEPRLGGRWYETSVDGEECDWGVVLA